MAESARIYNPLAYYTQAMREAHAEQHIVIMAALGPEAFERTQSRFIGPTYGLSPAFIRTLKARHRNELSFSGEGK